MCAPALYQSSPRKAPCSIRLAPSAVQFPILIHIFRLSQNLPLQRLRWKHPSACSPSSSSSPFASCSHHPSIITSHSLGGNEEGITVVYVALSLKGASPETNRYIPIKPRRLPPPVTTAFLLPSPTLDLQHGLLAVLLTQSHLLSIDWRCVFQKLRMSRYCFI